MKTFIFIISFLPLVIFAKPKIYFDYKVYYTPTHQPYVETLLQFSAASLKFKANSNGHLTSALEITQIFKFKDSIVSADKYIVQSPEMKDSTVEDYFDIEENFQDGKSYLLCNYILNEQKIHLRSHCL